MRMSKGAAFFPSTPLQAVSTLPLLAAPSIVSDVYLPELYSDYKASGDSLGLFVLLLLAKRLTLYACATTSVYVAARRSADAPPGLGARMEQLTAEALYPFEYPEAEQQEFKAVVKQLDTTSDATQAATLPLIFGALLVGAYIFNVLVGTPPPTEADDVADLAVLGEVLRGVATTFQPLSTASVCIFALNAELQAFVGALLPPYTPSNEDRAGLTEEVPAEENTPAPTTVITFACAVGAVGAAYLLPAGVAWPLQNTLNACIAIGVARVLQLPSLPAAAAALLGLTLYDGIGTLGAASAATELTQQGASVSVMEGVAQARLGGVGGASGGSALWQPGLITVLLQGRTTDALGLGDIVGPSILAGWAHRFDLTLGRLQSKPDETTKGDSSRDARGAGYPEQGGYLAAAMLGYAVGCVLLEIGPPELTRAALLFLAPPMFLAVFGRLALRGDLSLALRGAVEASPGQRQEDGRSASASNPEESD